MLGVGVDVLHLPRIRSLINRRGIERLATRILSSTELEDWRLVSNARQAQFLAVRYDAYTGIVDLF